MTDAPQFLYHGTSGAAARKAIADGLKPRGKKGKSNWKHTIESNPNSVYLTDAYPLYFAANCEKGDNDIAIIQLATDRLDKRWLVPDEDVLEQVGRGNDKIKGNMKQRTRYYRDNLVDYLATDKWEISLEAMGTCASLTPIDPSAITRVAFIKPSEARNLIMTAADAMVSLANYRFCGDKYRNLTNQIFGLPTVDDPFSSFPVPTTGDPAAIKMLESMKAQRDEYDRIMHEEIAQLRIEEINP